MYSLYEPRICLSDYLAPIQLIAYICLISLSADVNVGEKPIELDGILMMSENIFISSEAADQCK